MNLIYFCNKAPLQLFNWVLKYASVFWSVFSNKFADPSLHFYPLTPYFLHGRSAGQGDTISAFFIYFSLIDLISSYKSKPEIKELAIFDHCYHTSIFWWYNLFLTGRYLYKTHGWYFFFLTLIRLGFLKGVFSRNGERVNLTPTHHPLIFQEELI